MLYIARCVFFCSVLMLVFRSSMSAWSFGKETITTPAVKIIPESDGNFFYFDAINFKSSQHYIDSTKKFLNTYNRTHNVENIRYCDFNNPPPENSVCEFDTDSLGPCSQLKDFGYSRSSPCFYFTLSQVLNWVPIVLNGSEIQHNSDPFLNVPFHLRRAIYDVEDKKSVEQYVWLTCDGDTGADKENIGPVYYYPRKGFPTYYFPFTNVAGYQSPIVAVYLERPQRGVAIFIECKVWAKNIQLDKENEVGYVKFQLLID